VVPELFLHIGKGFPVRDEPGGPAHLDELPVPVEVPPLKTQDLGVVPVLWTVDREFKQKFLRFASRNPL
jgi:hypothetical protein